jgi:osmotically-inducible protein OsmY
VQTLNGEVLVSGFAKDAKEKAEAERLASETPGVKRVRSEIIVRP